MAGFDRYRFAEAFAAALLGAYVHNQFQADGIGPQGARDAVQKFQRSLLLAAGNDGFTEPVSLKYKQRISLLSKGGRMKYIRLTLQPNQVHCDERLTALLIFDHALQSNVEWEATVRMLSLDEPNVSEQASNAFGEFTGGVADAAKELERYIANSADKLRRERERKLSKPWLYPLYWLIHKLTTF